jgi:hypothetical protein
MCSLHNVHEKNIYRAGHVSLSVHIIQLDLVSMVTLVSLMSCPVLEVATLPAFVSGSSKKMAVFSVVAPCSLVEVYQRFRRTCCLHHQGNEQAKLDTCSR